MKKLKKVKWLVLVMAMGLFIFSCNQDELTDTISPSRKQETDVSLDLAQQVALDFTKSDGFIGTHNKNGVYARKLSSIPVSESKRIDEVIIIPDEKKSPALYVVTFKPNGYVIIPATMKESPILGFSENSKFQYENIPIGLAEWLVGRMAKIQALKYIKGLDVPIEVEEEWAMRAPSPEEEREDAESGGGTRSGGTKYFQAGPLLQTLWGQDNGYNDLVNDGNINFGISCLIALKIFSIQTTQH